MSTRSPSPPIAVELEGVELVDDPAAADVILLGGPDEGWTYPRLNAVFRRLVDGVPLVAMQRNRWWPTVDGPSLDAGAFVAGLEYATGIEATVVGKPAPGIFEVACELAGAPPREAAMVGDDLESDLRPARALGMRVVLVRTGKGASFSPGPGDVDLDAADLAAAVDAASALAEVPVASSASGPWSRRSGASRSGLGATGRAARTRAVPRPPSCRSR